MNRKQLGILLVLLLIVGGAGLLTYLRNNAAWRSGSDGSGQRILATFDFNAINRIRIRDKEASLTLLKQQERWEVDERSYPADFGRIRKMVGELRELKPVQKVRVGPSQLGTLQLLPPGEGGGTLVELFTPKSDQPAAALLLGKKHIRESALFPGDEGYADGRYLMPQPTGKTPDVSLVSQTLEELVPAPEKWIDPGFIQAQGIRSVTLHGTEETHRWELIRGEDDQWTLADLKEDEKVDPAAVPAFASLLGAPRLMDVLPPGATLDGPQTRVSVRTDDGFHYTLTFGKAENATAPVTLSVEATLALKRRPEKEETPEEKEKRDQAFATRREKLTRKIAREKALEGRVYLLSQPLFAALHKSRAELLESAPQPPGEAADPNPAPPRP